MAKPPETQWTWVGEPLCEPNADGRLKYGRARRQRPGEKDLVVKVGDVALMHIVEPDESGSVWIAQLLELCMLGPGERLEAEDEGLDGDGGGVDGGGDGVVEPLDDNARMRIGVRWLFRPRDYADEQAELLEPDPEPVPPLGDKELLWTDAIADPICNGIDVVDGRASLVSHESELEGVENGYVCNRYYYSHGNTYDINVPANPPSHLAGKRLRRIRADELKQLILKPLHASNGFWMERKTATPRKSTGRVGARSKSTGARGARTAEAERRKAGEGEPDGSAVLAGLSLADVMGQAGADALQSKVSALTTSQLDTLEDVLPELVKQLTGGIGTAATLEPDGVFGSQKKYERARDKAVEDSRKLFWDEHEKQHAKPGNSRSNGQS